MNEVVKYYEGNKWVEVGQGSDQELTLKMKFSSPTMQEVQFFITKNQDGSYLLTDKGILFKELKKRANPLLWDAMVSEFEFSAIRKGFQVQRKTVSRSVTGLESLDYVIRWPLQWTLETKGVFEKIHNIMDEPLSPVGINWTGTEEQFQDELND